MNVPERPEGPTRRGLLEGATAAFVLWPLHRGAAAALHAAAGTVEPAAAPAPRGTRDVPFQISLAQWSLHRAVAAGEASSMDFPAIARDEFGITACEFVSRFLLAEVTHLQRLQELRRRADDLGVRSLLIMVDDEGALGDADDGARRQSVDNHFKWLAAANLLGCHSIRVNAFGSGTAQEHAARVADSLHRLGVAADAYDLNVIVENHGGRSSDGAWLASVMRLSDHPRVGTLPDFGNFRISDTEEYDRYRGVAELMPFARAVSAKSYGFDAAGNETTIDYPRMLRIVLDAGYHGHLGIEYEGGQLSERDGIRATLALLKRLQTELA